MKSLDTALRVASLFKDVEEPLGVVEIAERLALNKSHVSRILASMRRAGLLVQNPRTRRYSVGVEAFAIGVRYINGNPLARAAVPVIRACSELTGHSVFISVRHDDCSRHILAVEGPHFEESQWRVGIRLALHATASGKVLLAFGPESAGGATLDAVALPRLTPRTITDRDALRETLSRVRAQGWAEARGETVVGLAACAVPVFGRGEALCAAFGVVAPAALLPETALRDTVAILHDHAQRLSLLLGARSYPVPD
ncbi:IclR family transcriptional regulator [Rubrimonas cliftonensis]|uniref:Transcriptional regulator, IclR family n=1 Tax=Rubrimonas cliftonensis TaxID=89524 RepID=A0A1H4FMU4_9RHOB|nr:IclR family transcriptional regulator [Rubrimonas cliftonensis]SEA98636.1 transcriptional regulator, IclR family [Rubrimonas cliftonensis]